MANPSARGSHVAHSVTMSDEELSSYSDQGHVTRVVALLGAVRDIASSLSTVSMQLESEVGCLVQSDEPSTLTEELAQRLVILTSENSQLREALGSRLVIEQAKGMLMLEHSCDAAEAFAMLVSASRRQRRKVREVAASLVQHVASCGELPDLGGRDHPRLLPRAVRGNGSEASFARPRAEDGGWRPTPHAPR